MDVWTQIETYLSFVAVTLDQEHVAKCGDRVNCSRFHPIKVPLCTRLERIEN